MKREMKKTAAISFAFVLSAIFKVSSASSFEGIIQQVQINPGASPVRVSIFVASHGSPCAMGNWFAYEDGDTGIGKIWTAAVLSAYATGKTVSIVGTNTCDPYSVEKVSYIHLK